jgi:dTDP-4-dehydrorhamnose reductase
MNNKKKILVTGAKGPLGKKIIEMLGNDYKLVLTDSEEMDITDKDKVFEVIGQENPDFIIHGAAYTRVDDAEEKVDLCRKINAEGSKNVAMAAKENNTTLLYISTDFVFDGINSQESGAGSLEKDANARTIPYTEFDTPHPLSVYAQTKLEGENFIREICSKYYIFRTAWLFGELPEGHPGTNFVEAMLKLAAERDSLNVVADQIGSPTYTGDLVKVIHQIVSSQESVASSNNGNYQLPTTNYQPVPYGTYHFSGTGACSWYDFAKEIFKQTNTKIDLKPISSNEYPQKAKRPSYSYLDKSKIEKALGVKVRPWQEMLSDYLASR